ncbi:hypothetical protein [Actinoplanes sp. NPDC049681]|uniref:hypothetical protein n=1 Tax=Actinoplanes sp. NPDC049681 TaxID=3363905 RepID=UPI003798C556
MSVGAEGAGRSVEAERDAVPVPGPRSSRRFWPISPVTESAASEAVAERSEPATTPDALEPPAAGRLTDEPVGDENRGGRRTTFGLRKSRPAAEEADSTPAAPTAGPTDVRLVNLDATPDLDVTPELDRQGDDEDDLDGHSDDREPYGLAALGLAAEDVFEPGARETPGDDGFEPADADWLAEEDVRLADLPFAAVPVGREQGDLEDPELSGDFEAVQDTDASGSFPAALDPFAVGGYEVDPFEADPPVRRHLSERRYGDRVEGWVRPQYRDAPASGDYWTPVPDAGYGWPVPVERIPAAPPYPPSSGFDPVPEVESEPTAVVPQWPPARPDDRIGVPRAWSGDDARGEFPPRRRRLEQAAAEDWAADDANSVPEEPDAPYRSRRDADIVPVPNSDKPGPESAQGTGYAGRPESAEGPIWTVPDLPDAALPDLAWSRSTADDQESRRYRRSSIPVRRRRGGGGDPTQHIPAIEAAPARPRPRPRPRPNAGQPEPRSTVYVSKHAAEPS